MNVLITGATGFIGSKLIEALLDQSYGIIAVSRDTEAAHIKLPSGISVTGWESAPLKTALESSDVVINLAGASIASGPWTRKRKAAILNSRLLAAQRLLDAINTLNQKPPLFMQASAIGFYGHRPDMECSEICDPGEGFLADVCKKWEGHIPALEKIISRVITLRIGVVLGKEGGIIPELRKQAARHLAGRVGSGDQWISWIHIYDLVYAILYLINHEKAKGVFNLTAPRPVQQKDFAAMLKKASGAGIQLPAPAFMIRTLLGEFGKELLLNGQKVSAAKLIRQGFAFKYKTAEDALSDLFAPYGT